MTARDLAAGVKDASEMGGGGGGESGGYVPVGRILKELCR